jgi:hypothetical protein
MVVVLATKVVATKSTTIVTARSTKRYPTVAEATVSGHAALMTAVEVPATSSGQPEGPARVRKTALFPGHKSSKGKSESR